MDERLIIETQTAEASAQKQMEVHLARVQKYRDEGYTVITQPDNSFWIYPKNALTGQTDMTAMPTKLWAEPIVTPDDTFEIPAPIDVAPAYTGQPELDYIVRERPPEWLDPAAGK